MVFCLNCLRNALKHFWCATQTLHLHRRGNMNNQTLQRISKYSLIIIIVFLHYACTQNTTEPLQSPTVSTDKSTYASYQTINISLRNDSKSTAYFYHCDNRLGFFIEQKVNSTWSENGSVAEICLAIYPSGEKAMRPGMTNADTLMLADSGLYRLKYRFGSQPSNTWADSAMSNEFSVH